MAAAPLHYRWAGNPEGETLVLSHSLGADGSMWVRQVGPLGERFRLLLPDHRGHGGSEMPEGPWAIDDFVGDTLALLDHLELERVSLCGVSLGGMVGLGIAEQAPERLDRLVVANSSAYTEDPSLLRGRIRRIEEEGLEAVADDVMEKWFTEEFRQSNPKLVSRFRDGVLATAPEAYCHTSEAVCGLDLRAGLDAIGIPVLVVTGDEDEATPPAWGEAIARAIPGAELLRLEAAHLSNVEAAEPFNEAVVRFLSA